MSPRPEPRIASREPRAARPSRYAWLVASLVTHVSVLSLAGIVAYQLSRERDRHALETHTAPPTEVVAVELPTFAEGTLLADHDVVPEGTIPSAHGGATIARVDTGTLGKGGSATGARAINLAALDEDLSLSPDPTSRLDRDQHQRLKTAAFRTTHEDRRATTHPMEVTFLATGTGEHQERRPSAPADPSRGSLVAAPRIGARRARRHTRARRGRRSRSDARRRAPRTAPRQPGRRRP